MSTLSHAERTAMECLEGVIRSFDKSSRDLAAAMEQVLDAGERSPEEMSRVESRVAGLLVDFQRCREGLIAESLRQGRSSQEVDRIYARCAGAPPQIELMLSRSSIGSLPAQTHWHVAADAGRVDAQFVLGCVLLGQRDEREAFKYLSRAAEQGHSAALFEVAGLLHQGLGVTRDRVKAVATLRKAADTGSIDAMYTLAMTHLTGANGDVDPAEVVSLLTKAAEAGHAEAQLELGRIHAMGLADEIDFAAALKWLSMAKAQHRSAAADWIDKYGNLASDDYCNALWLDAWNPDSQPLPQRTSLIGKLVSFAFLTILVITSVRGNSLGLFLLLLFFAVLAHETGHFLVARMVGIPIRVFKAGMGPLLWSSRGRGSRLPTRFEVRLIPLLGSVEGYVAPRGVWNYWRECWKAEDTGKPVPPRPQFDTKERPMSVASFFSRPKRLAYYLGGVTVNLLLAVVCLWTYENYTEAGRSMTAPIAGRVPAGSVAESAGLREEDLFVSIDGKEVAHGFFEVLDRLAPDNPAAAAGQSAVSPGATINVVVRRGDHELTLSWPRSSQPGGEDAAKRHGLNPPESWRIDDVDPSVAETLHTDDTIQSFGDAERRISTVEAGAHEAFRRAFAMQDGKNVSLDIDRPGEVNVQRVSVTPAGVAPASSQVTSVAEGEKYTAPFRLARLRQEGPPTSLSHVLSNIGVFGVKMVVALPQDMVAAATRGQSHEEKGRLLKAVKHDPWSALMFFGSINVFLLFLNLLPVPPLDGFHVMCGVIEMVIRRDLPTRVVSILMFAGWLLLGAWLLLNGFLIIRDLAGTLFS